MFKPSKPPVQPSHFRKRLDRVTSCLTVAFLTMASATAIVAVVYLASAGLIQLPKFDLSGIHVLSGKSPASSQNRPRVEKQVWKGKSRVTILLMGLDHRSWEADDAPRSDSMWLLTVDPVTKTAGMLSIPRDLWVDVPGFGAAKINMAYFYGETNHIEGGGAALAVQTVEQWIGKPIDFYGVVDFQAFTELIDQMGGVSIDVPQKIKVDPVGRGNTVVLKPGRQTLSGAEALGYARNRYTDGGDFDRMARQMQVILAIRDQMLQPGEFVKLIGKAPQIYEIIHANVQTNLTLEQAVQLAWLAQEIPSENIHKAVIGPDQVVNSWSWQGWAILLPDQAKIATLLDEVFSTTSLETAISASMPAPTQEMVLPTASAEVSTPVEEANTSTPAEEVNTRTPAEEVKTDTPEPTWQAENATILVQNGTQTGGLAATTCQYLKKQGLNVLAPMDAKTLYTQTIIIDNNGKQATLQYLMELLHVKSNQVFNGAGDATKADVVVILGSDWADSNSMY